MRSTYKRVWVEISGGKAHLVPNTSQSRDLLLFPVSSPVLLLPPPPSPPRASSIPFMPDEFLSVQTRTVAPTSLPRRSESLSPYLLHLHTMPETSAARTASFLSYLFSCFFCLNQLLAFFSLPSFPPWSGRYHRDVVNTNTFVEIIVGETNITAGYGQQVRRERERQTERILVAD